MQNTSVYFKSLCFDGHFQGGPRLESLHSGFYWS